MVEGNSSRSVERLMGVHRDTIMRVLRRVGQDCERIMDEQLRGLHCKRIEADELWTFCHKEERRLGS